jgi:hypothetical protein
MTATTTHLRSNPNYKILGISDDVIKTFWPTGHNVCGLEGEKWFDWKSYYLFNTDMRHASVSDITKIHEHYMHWGWREERNYTLADEYDCTAEKNTSAIKLIKNLNNVDDRPVIIFFFHEPSMRCGGTGTFVERLYKLLQKKYNIVFVYPWTGAIIRIEINKYWIMQRHYNKGYDLLKSLKASGIYLVHFANFESYYIERLVKYLGIPCIATLHDYFYMCKDNPVPDIYIDKAICNQRFPILKTASLITCPSNDIRNVYNDNFPNMPYKVIPHEKINFCRM